MLLRSRRKISREVSLYDPIGTDKEGNEISLLDIIEGEAVDVAEQMDLRSDTERLRCLFDQVLTERERRVLTMRYGIGGVGEKTQREIAQICGISRSYVSRIEKGAIRKLREGFCARNPRGRE
ncbi:MAG: sigma-70 family RNA polymerase sigma factor [Candidatus Limivivens sp.]|nr:sigma-70 family RNA polymerase sigma factor [Candidatus Limivivens sp.]